jgi:hypothetical protein
VARSESARLRPSARWRARSAASPDWEARLNGTTTTFISAEQVSAWLEMLEAGDVRH